jgi:hypothetical protein
MLAYGCNRRKQLLQVRYREPLRYKGASLYLVPKPSVEPILQERTTPRLAKATGDRASYGRLRSEQIARARAIKFPFTECDVARPAKKISPNQVHMNKSARAACAPSTGVHPGLSLIVARLLQHARIAHVGCQGDIAAGHTREEMQTLHMQSVRTVRFRLHFATRSRGILPLLCV